MVVNGNSMFIKEIRGIEVVEKIDYLGSFITNKEGSEEEIIRKLAIARNSTMKFTGIWNDTAIS